MSVKIKIVFAWYDFWVGVFWDRRKRNLFIFPIPMIGLKIEFGNRENYYEFAKPHYRNTSECIECGNPILENRAGWEVATNLYCDQCERAQQ